MGQSPVAFSVTKASNSEQTETKKLLWEIDKVHNEWLESCRYFLGDKGYDSGSIIRQPEGKGITPIIDIRNCWRLRSWNLRSALLSRMRSSRIKMPNSLIRMQK